MKAAGNAAVAGESGIFLSAHEKFLELTGRLQSHQSRSMTLSDLEKYLATEGRELLRRLLEEHIRFRGAGDVGPVVLGADDVERTYKCPMASQRALVWRQKRRGVSYDRVAWCLFSPRGTGGGTPSEYEARG